MHADGEEPGWLKDASPAVRKMYAYWDSKRAGRKMPARADIDPVEIPEFLRFLTLVDVVPDARRYVYRLVGTYEVSVREKDPTGQSVIEAFFGPSPEYALGNYDKVVATKAPHYDNLPIEGMQGRVIDDETMFLPLSSDGKSVDIILVFSTYKDNREI